jgi:hypothetical protein
MERPDSSYSAFAIHICWNVLRDAKIEPPIQTLYFLSGSFHTPYAAMMTSFTAGYAVHVFFFQYTCTSKNQLPVADRGNGFI